MIQIFGTNKNYDVKKAQMWFKERRIEFQFIDLKEKAMSRGEFESVVSVFLKKNGSKNEVINQMIDKNNKNYSQIAYIDESEKIEKLFENQELMELPICRNGKNEATVGIETKTWETWK